jgi:lycopene beta-cyclase
VLVDVAIVGSGGAGSSLLLALDRELTRRHAAGHDVATPSVVVVDPVHRAADDRTWCFWDDGVHALESRLHRAWHQVAVQTVGGEQVRLDLGRRRYVMLRSSGVYAAADEAAARLGAERRTVAVQGVEQDGEAVRLALADGSVVRARWAFDSRPTAPERPARTAWWQHFRGWVVQFEPTAGRPGPFSPDLPMLMDLSVPQPPRSVSFGYVLPDDEHRALVEHTVFSRDRWVDPVKGRDDGARYDDALKAYLAGRWPDRTYRVLEVEDGAIPMSDAYYPRQVGRRVMRLGTAGGSTRPSTGYTFATMQRQASVVARRYFDGLDPVPPQPHSRRHAWMDSVLLRAFDEGLVDGAALFSTMLTANPPSRVVDFLDGRSSLGDDVALMRSLPFTPMLRAALLH